MPALQTYRSAPRVCLEEFDGACRFQMTLRHDLTPGLHKSGGWIDGHGHTNTLLTTITLRY